jgi:hypothetical protein
VRHGLQVPRVFAEEISVFHYLQAQIRHVAELRDICGKVQHFAGM